MKKIIVLSFLLVTFFSFSQNQKATLFFKDGTHQSGYAKIIGSDEIKFKKDKKAKKEIYNSDTIEALYILENDKNVVYHYKKVKNKKNLKLLELLEKGILTLYRDLNQGYTAGFAAGGVGGFGGGGRHYSISSYYVSKDENSEVYHLGSTDLFSKNFKKAATDYFKDCPSLVSLIEARKLKKKDIVEIVQYYNKNCNQ